MHSRLRWLLQRVQVPAAAGTRVTQRHRTGSGKMLPSRCRVLENSLEAVWPLSLQSSVLSSVERAFSELITLIFQTFRRERKSIIFFQPSSHWMKEPLKLPSEGGAVRDG